jgi:anti-sigma B factor antagonist
MKTRTIHNGKIAIFDLRGSLVGDDETDQLRAAVADYLEQGNKFLVLNLQRVTYLNSSGIGAIISAHANYRRQGGEVRLAGVTKNVQNLFVVTRLVDIFEVFETVEDAVESFMQTVKSSS